MCIVRIQKLQTGSGRFMQKTGKTLYSILSWLDPIGLETLRFSVLSLSWQVHVGIELEVELETYKMYSIIIVISKWKIFIHEMICELDWFWLDFLLMTSSLIWSVRMETINIVLVNVGTRVTCNTSYRNNICVYIYSMYSLRQHESVSNGGW